VNVKAREAGACTHIDWILDTGYWTLDERKAESLPVPAEQVDDGSGCCGTVPATWAGSSRLQVQSDMCFCNASGCEGQDLTLQQQQQQQQKSMPDQRRVCGDDNSRFPRLIDKTAMQENEHITRWI